MGVETMVRWGDMEDDEVEDLDLPPKQVIGPDEAGVKKVIVYSYNEEGHKVKTTTTIHVRKISMRAMERRAWSKFGDVVVVQGDAATTILPNEEIFIHPPTLPGCIQEKEIKIACDPVPKTTGVLMVCRSCGRKGDHWTARCPLKDLSGLHVSSDLDNAAPAPLERSYVPPNRRREVADTSNTRTRDRNYENSVRVNNLSEETTEADLVELFQSFGPISRTYVPRHKTGSINRGFGFVNFVKREDAERAINRLNGHGYANLILQVEWAAPRTT